MFSFKKSLVALIAVFTFYGVEARADTFVITNVGGAVFVVATVDAGPPTLKLPPAFYLSGPGFSVQTFIPAKPGGDVGNVEARDACIIIPCAPGMVIGSNSSFSGIIAPAFGTSATVNGVQYPFIQLTGALNFVSSPIVIPVTAGDFHVTMSFTFSGDLTGNSFQPNIVNPVFTASLSGRGLANFNFYNVARFDESPTYRLAWVEYYFEPVPFSIDIKPGTFPNNVNPNSKGKLPVAILTTHFFDATAIDPATILFGATGNETAPVHWATQDVDGDGDIDMVLHFVTQETGITCGIASASLTGATFSGVRIKGSDSIETAPCN
jgi:hypothetical protein